MTTEPRISVVTPVYNGQRWLPVVESQILGQTFSDFEWIIVDDGLTDCSPTLLRDLARRDERVRPIFPGRVGFVNALNLGVARAQAPLIARQDIDDGSEPDRLDRQYRFMLRNENVGVLGGYWKVINVGRGESFVRMPPTDHVELIRHLPIYIPFAHTLVMFRQEAWRQAGGYKDLLCAEDLLLWIEIAARGWELANLPLVLGSHLVHTESFWYRNFKYAAMMKTMAHVQAQAIRKLNLPPWMYVYPMTRYLYAFCPNNLKRLVRRRIVGEADQADVSRNRPAPQA